MRYFFKSYAAYSNIYLSIQPLVFNCRSLFRICPESAESTWEI